MKITVGDVTNNKCNVRDYMSYDEDTGRIYVKGEAIDTVLIDKSEEWKELNERVNKLESFKRSAEYTVDSETLELIIDNQDSDRVLSFSETYDEKIYLLQKRVQELERDKEELYKLNQRIGKEAWKVEQQNKRYWEFINNIKTASEQPISYDELLRVIQNEYKALGRESE